MQNTIADLFAHPAEKKYTLIVVTLNSPLNLTLYLFNLEMALEIEVSCTLLNSQVFMDLREKIQVKIEGNSLNL